MNDNPEGQKHEFQTGDNVVTSTLRNFDYFRVLARLKEVAFSPKTVWGEVQREAASLKELYMSYFLPMNLIVLICAYIGKVIRFNAVFGTLLGSIIQLFIALGTLWVAAKLMELLAPKFSGTATFIDSARLFCFSMFPAMASQVFLLVHGPVATLLLLSGGLYSLYIFVTGVPHMLQIPEERKVGYLVTVVLLLGVALATASLVLGKVFPYVG
jgi:hypothetical protein